MDGLVVIEVLVEVLAVGLALALENCFKGRVGEGANVGGQWTGSAAWVSEEEAAPTDAGTKAGRFMMMATTRAMETVAMQREEGSDCSSTKERIAAR